MVGSAPKRYGLRDNLLSRMANAPMRATFEEFEHGRVAERLGEIAQEAVGAETAADLLIVEDDPAQGFQPLVFAARQEFS